MFSFRGITSRPKLSTVPLIAKQDIKLCRVWRNLSDKYNLAVFFRKVVPSNLEPFRLINAFVWATLTYFYPKLTLFWKIPSSTFKALFNALA